MLPCNVTVHNFAEVSVVRGLGVNRSEQVELLDDIGRLERKGAVHGALDCFFGHGVRAESVDVHADGIGIADRVGELNFATRGEASRDDILGDPAAHVSGAAIDLTRVLPGKRAAAVPAPAAVAVDDNLAAGQARIALRTADDETSGWVDEKLGGAVDHRFRKHLPNHLLDAKLFDFLVIDFLGVLGGDNDVGNADRFSVLVNHRDLRLRVGPEPIGFAALANPRQLAAEPMGEHDRSRHQFRSIIAGETEHQALVARALLRRLLSLGLLRVHSLRDISRLAGNDVLHEQPVRVENIVVVHVTDLAHGITHDLDVIEVRLGRDLAAHHHHVALGVGLAGHAALFVDGQAGVEYGVGDGVTNFIRMTFANGFGSKNETSEHGMQLGDGDYDGTKKQMTSQHIDQS